ncbi:hypothetical protein WMF30_16305 [Sorangium sp. So ce134]
MTRTSSPEETWAGRVRAWRESSESGEEFARSRGFACWPRERYLELAPRYWARTRARLVAGEMKLPLGPITVPPPLPAEEQRARS